MRLNNFLNDLRSLHEYGKVEIIRRIIKRIFSHVHCWNSNVLLQNTIFFLEEIMRNTGLFEMIETDSIRTIIDQVRFVEKNN